MKTWHFERLLHAVWLCTGATMQHHEVMTRALLDGHPGDLWKLSGLTLFILGMLAFGGATSTSARQKERSETLLDSHQTWVLGEKPVAARYLKWGKILVALSAIQGQALLSVFSMLWDVVIYPSWRKYWRTVHPLGTWDMSEHD